MGCVLTFIVGNTLSLYLTVASSERTKKKCVDINKVTKNYQLEVIKVVTQNFVTFIAISLDES